jgi:phosphoglycolate phosphatase-like HAD superfamily hydrolase
MNGSGQDRSADGVPTACGNGLGPVLAGIGGALLIWDFDGVIADSEPLHAASYRHVLQARGYQPPTGFFDDLIGRTESEIWDVLAGRGAPVRPRSINALMDERQGWFLARAFEELRPTWIAQALVPAAARLARRQVVVSNGEPSTVTVLLQHWGLDELELIPHPSAGRDKASILRELCAALPPVLVIEDNPAYLRLCRSLGAFTVGVRHGFNRGAQLDPDVLLELPNSSMRDTDGSSPQ